MPDPSLLTLTDVADRLHIHARRREDKIRRLIVKLGVPWVDANGPAAKMTRQQYGWLIEALPSSPEDHLDGRTWNGLSEVAHG